MAFNFPLSSSLKKARWKVKIRDRERCEPPHVTIIKGTDAWRIDLRTREFMDDSPDPALVPKELLNLIFEEKALRQICEQWDKMYPNDKVSGDSGNEE